MSAAIGKGSAVEGDAVRRGCRSIAMVILRLRLIEKKKRQASTLYMINDLIYRASSTRLPDYLNKREGTCTKYILSRSYQ